MAARRRLSILLVASLCGGGTLILTGCSNSPSGSSSAGTTTSTASTSPSASTTSPTSTTSTTSGAAQNLVATASVKAALLAVYLAHNKLPADQVAGTVAGSVYFGFLPATSTYWAIAAFEPTADASMQTQVAMQDEGCCGIFTMPSGEAWRFVESYPGTPCPAQLPPDLFGLWHLSVSGECTPPSTTQAP